MCFHDQTQQHDGLAKHKHKIRDTITANDETQHDK
jgi:hypothetical protein